MRLALLLIACFVHNAKSQRIVEVSGGGRNPHTDLTGTGLTRGYCIVADKECPGTDVWRTTFAPTLRDCRIKCSQHIKCLSFTWAANKKCHLRGNRCPPGELKTAEGATTMYRLKEGESCPPDQDKYVEKQYNYSGKFCMWEGKACPGRNLYDKPIRKPTWEACLKKCINLPSCSGADFKNGQCWPKETPFCTNEELVEDPDMQNFLRLKNGVYECPANRVAPPTTTEAPTTMIPTNEPTTEPTTQTTPEPTTSTLLTEPTTASTAEPTTPPTTPEPTTSTLLTEPTTASTAEPTTPPTSEPKTPNPTTPGSCQRPTTCGSVCYQPSPCTCNCLCGK